MSDNKVIGTGRRDSGSIAVLHASASPSDVKVGTGFKPAHPATTLISQKDVPAASIVNSTLVLP